MFKDLRLYVNDEQINYEYKLDGDRLIINIIISLEKDSILEIVYDENIYDITFDNFTNYKNEKKWKKIVQVNNCKYSFYVSLKKNFLVKSFYEFINTLSNKEKLINDINLFINTKVGKNYKNDLSKLLNLIDNNEQDLEYLLINNANEFERIFNLLVNNKTYLTIIKNMTDLELMLLITDYAFMYNVPEISQDKFNDLVMIANDYDHALENLWRLGMNYDQRGYNFDLLDEIFVNSKDVGYLGKYVSGIIQLNKEKIVNKIIEINDKEFIKKILGYDILMYNFSEKQKQKLEKILIN